MDDVYFGRLYYDSGELLYEGEIRRGIRAGRGVRYFKNGRKHKEGRFGDWFIEEGRESYENGVEYDKAGNIVKIYKDGKAKDPNCHCCGAMLDDKYIVDPEGNPHCSENCMDQYCAEKGLEFMRHPLAESYWSLWRKYVELADRWEERLDSKTMNLEDAADDLPLSKRTRNSVNSSSGKRVNGRCRTNGKSPGRAGITIGTSRDGRDCRGGENVRPDG